MDHNTLFAITYPIAGPLTLFVLLAIARLICVGANRAWRLVAVAEESRPLHLPPPPSR